MGKTTVLTPEREKWDSLVSLSSQGTIFSTTKWLDLIGQPYKIYAVHKGDELIGGAANFDSPAPLTPFQGILVKPEEKYTTAMALHYEVTKALMDYLPNEFYNHSNYRDIRPFKWNENWELDVKYTYIIHSWSMDGMEKQTRYDISHYREWGMSVTPDIEKFIKLYQYTFERKGLKPTASDDLIRRIYEQFPCTLGMTANGESGALFIRDDKRSYYILGASEGKGSSSYCLWASLTVELAKSSEIDLVGCNDYSIAQFKKGFGGILTPYYGLRRKDAII